MLIYRTGDQAGPEGFVETLDNAEALNFRRCGGIDTSVRESNHRTSGSAVSHKSKAIARSKNGRALMVPEHQQILVAGYESVGFGGKCGGQNRVLVRVAANSIRGLT